MAFPVLEEAIEPLRKQMNECDFPTIIRDARESIGLKQYRAAEFIGVTCNRLKNLESGYFRDVPALSVLAAIARLYDFNPNLLEEKAVKFCDKSSIRRQNRNKYYDPML
ncbi:MAG: hypothetical protein K1000chlam2_00041 [Chlamydiae bacterium]|nr:hypothetical protein [Chlamydiota bacterium]